MELRQLSYFAKVVELRSITKSATALHLTQPSLSRQIQALEREIGEPLFVRTAFGMEPTPCGVSLHQHALTIFGQLERVPEIVRTASQGQRLVRVGVPQGLPERWGLTLLDMLSEHLPRVRVSLHEATTEEQRELLQNGLIHVGLIHMEPPELCSELLLRQPAGVVVPPGSPLECEDSVRLAQLDGLTVMAHAIGEVNLEVSRLQAASTAAYAHTQWLFRRFSEHSYLIALASGVDAALVTEASAARHFPSWRWILIEDHDIHGEDLDIRTWATWREHDAPHVFDVVDLMKRAAQREPPRSGEARRSERR